MTLEALSQLYRVYDGPPPGRYRRRRQPLCAGAYQAGLQRRRRGLDASAAEADAVLVVLGRLFTQQVLSIRLS
ncbi:MAG: hypothetical protein ACPGOV_12400 [Magnetovibrionaceae bacterium]